MKSSLIWVTAEKKVLEAEDNVTLDEVLNNLTNEELAALGLDLTDYKRFEYGYYVAEEALGASTIEEFKTKLAAGIAKSVSVNLRKDLFTKI